MSRRPIDDKALRSIVKSFREIADLLERWAKADNARGEVHEFPEYNLDKVAEEFVDIVNELKSAGPIGSGIYDRFPALADHLESAARALENK